MPSVVVGEAETRAGTLTLLRRAGGGLELFLDGIHLMSSAETRSEDDLAGLAHRRWKAENRQRTPRCLVLGLGLGCTVRELTRLDSAAFVVVVELFQPLVEWLGSRPETSEIFANPRVAALVADASRPPLAARSAFDIVLLDVGNGPLDPVLERNEPLYARDGLLALRDLLAPGGLLGVWAAHRSAGFEGTLRRCFGTVESTEIELAAGRPGLEPDVVYLCVR